MQIKGLATLVKYDVEIFICAVFGLLLLIVIFLSTLSSSPKERMRTLYAERSASGTPILVQGTNLQGDLHRTATYLSLDLFSWLPYFPQGHYALLLDGDTWLLVFDNMLSPEEEQVLHLKFSSGFSPGVVRTRTVPSGAKITDIVEDTEGTQSTEWKMGGYAVRESVHVRSKEHFLSATGKGMTFLTNDSQFLQRVLE